MRLLSPPSLVFRIVAVLCVFSAEALAGHTHYFRWLKPPEQAALRECAGDMGRIISARRNILAGEDGTNAPVFDGLHVVFNGMGDDAHEPFVFPDTIREDPSNPQLPSGFSGCKTAGKPYDAAVTACLITARDHFPASVLEIESDGSWDDGDWAAGAALYTEVLGRQARNPMSGKHSDETHAAGRLFWVVMVLGTIGMAIAFLRRKSAFATRNR